MEKKYFSYKVTLMKIKQAKIAQTNTFFFHKNDMDVFTFKNFKVKMNEERRHVI